jgi:integrase
MIGTVSIQTVQALAPGQTLWDTAVGGFGVRRQQGKPTYVVKYRASGRQRFLTIGAHGAPWTPDKARKEAKRLLGLIATGSDPAADKAALRSGETLGEVVDAYLPVAGARLRPRTLYEITRHLRVNWAPFHSVSIQAITRRAIAERLRELSAKQGPHTAVHARGALSTCLTWAIREGYELPSNPVQGTNKPAKPSSRDRVLSDAELRSIWLACGEDDHGRIVKLLMLTGQRCNEIGGMQWSELSPPALAELGSAQTLVWTLPATRSKNHREHRLTLPASAVALLPPARTTPFLFGRQGFTSWSSAKVRLDAAIAKQGEALPFWVLHDLRRTAATIMADRLAVDPHIIEALLNHITGHRSGVAGVYNRAKYQPQIAEALAKWSVELQRIIEGRPRSITLRRREG